MHRAGMKKTHFVSIILIAFFLLDMTNESTAQRQDVDWSVGFDAGLLLFYGDIKEKDFIPVLRNRNEVKLGGGINVKRRLNPYLSLQFHMIWGKLSGTNRTLEQYFISDIFNWNVNANISINEIVFYPENKGDLQVYLMLGAGLVDFRSKLFDLNNNEIVDVIGYSHDGKSKEKMTTELVIPLGFGASYGMHNLYTEENVFFDKVDIVFEFRWYFTNTDKIDMSNAVRSGKDQYSFASIGLHYNF